MEIRVNDFFARRERILEGLSNLLTQKIAQEKEKARQVAENHKLDAIEDSKLKSDYMITCVFYIPKGYHLPQRVVHIHDGNNCLLMEMPSEAAMDIALKAVDKYIGNFLDIRV